MGKRKKTTRLKYTPIIVSSDDDDGNQKSITECGKDIGASFCNMKKAITNDDMMLVEKGLEHTAPCLSIFPPRCKDSECVGRNVSGGRSKMDSSTFNIYFEHTWRSVSEDKRSKYAHLDSLYFLLHRKYGSHSLKPIKSLDIFSKKYVFVPIVCWDHWRLVIFVHFGEDTHSRCILLLDSAEMCANLIEPDLREFVYDIYKACDRPESKDDVYRIPILVPKVPQQTNDVDCGRFVLYFIKLFIDSAPENFSHSNGFPNFMTRDRFDADSFAKFCNKLDEISPMVKQGTGQVPRRCSQRIKTSTSNTLKPSRPVEVILLEGSATSPGAKERVDMFD